MITIVDYGLGNLGSIRNMLKKIGVPSIATSDTTEIEQSTKLILPGVGHFDRAMSCIADRGLTDVLNKKALEDKVPILGICLGMQLLARKSEEGVMPGLGWIPADVVKLRPKENEPLIIPHMGWNNVVSKNGSVLTEGFDEKTRFYFVHSYYILPDNPLHTIIETNHGGWFTCGVNFENIYGVQFHPEKSHRFGMNLLRNFSQI